MDVLNFLNCTLLLKYVCGQSRSRGRDFLQIHEEKKIITVTILVILIIRETVTVTVLITFCNYYRCRSTVPERRPGETIQKNWTMKVLETNAYFLWSLKKIMNSGILVSTFFADYEEYIGWDTSKGHVCENCSEFRHPVLSSWWSVLAVLVGNAG